MGPKRGRPISGDTNDQALERRRQQTRERVRQHRQRQGVSQPARVANTPAQLAQGEQLVSLAASVNDEAPATLAQVGLRVIGATLAQDPYDAELRHDALAIDEHESLYQDRQPAIEDNRQSRQSSGLFRQFATSRTTQLQGSQQDQQDLSQYFRTLPPANPVGSTTRPDAPIVGLSARESVEQESGPSSPTFFEDDYVTDPHSFVATASPSVSSGEENDGFEIDQFEGTPMDGVIEGLVEINSAVPTNERGSEASGQMELQLDENSDAASSPLLFASEHSDNECDENEISALNYATQKLFEQLQGGFHGCSNNEHEESLRAHMNSSGDDHNSLDDLFNDRTFPSVLGLSEMISADRLARQEVPSASQWEAMFCGTIPRPEPLRPRPMHVCLHKEETQAVEPQVAFDIDSFLGFASSLAMARQGLWHQPAPQMRQNMTADNHLQSDMFHSGVDPDQPERASSAMLRDIPHFLLGRIVGAHDITVHVLFPHMTVVGDKFRSLTTEQLSRWLDQVFHPAVYKYCEAHYTQHLPASYQHAFANSKAHQVEGRQIETASYQAQQAIGYHLQPEYLEQIWQDILDTIAQQPGLADFREPHLFFSAKGTKLQFKTSPSRPTLLDAMENFVSFLERIVDLNFVQLERLYVDIGKEICPRVSLLPSQRGHVEDEAQVYMWRRCCLERYMQWAYDGKPPGSGRGQRYYEQNMLYEACSLTSVTPKSSKFREGGLVYSQFYGSVKEVSDAAKCKPFDNDGLEELALDPQILRGARQAAGGRRRDVKIIEHAYCASKRRAKVALQDSMRKSFGIREEHRVSWDLFQGLRSRLEEEDREHLEVLLPDCPSYAWAIKTQVYLSFLWRSADKFAAGFEVIRARCQQDFVTWEQTKVMAMFLRCLRFVFGGHQTSRESALWWSRRERTVGEPAQLRVWYGLGFSNTLKRYGYCWLEPRMDWTRLQFKADITDHALFGNAVLRGQYLRRGGQVQAFFDLTRRMELALNWIERFRSHEHFRDRLLSWMCHICLEQFRQDILHSIKHEILPQHQEKALKGELGFCMEYFEEIMTDGVHLVSGNRCDFKRVHDLGTYLFSLDDGLLRKHWDDKPYRKLFQRAIIGLSVQEDGRATRKAFQRRLYRLLYDFHWILPYPTPEVFLQTTKQGHRMWYSIAVEDEAYQKPSSSGWRWERKSWQPGRPQALPGWVSWSKEEWERWLVDH